MFGDPVGHRDKILATARNPFCADPFESVTEFLRDKEDIMGELTDKIKGNVNEAIGKVKQQSNDPETRDEGTAQELKGKGQQTIGKVKGALGDDI
jgi:uncharacterized protein YjbJ (UPF0337 family)